MLFPGKPCIQADGTAKSVGLFTALGILEPNTLLKEKPKPGCVRINGKLCIVVWFWAFRFFVGFSLSLLGSFQVILNKLLTA